MVSDTPEGLAEIYAAELVSQATVVTPNAFEAGLLTGMPCTTEQEGRAVCEALHAAGPEKVVITSIDQPHAISLIGSTSGSISLSPSASSAAAAAVHPAEQFQIDVPRLEQYFGGTGDLLAGLLLAHGAGSRDVNLAAAASLAVGSVQAVLGRTLEAREAGAVASGGLQLVASREALLDPPGVEVAVY